MPSFIFATDEVCAASAVLQIARTYFQSSTRGMGPDQPARVYARLATEVV